MERWMSNRTMQKKIVGEWMATSYTEDQEEVYRSLANDLIAKKINQCSYIKSIRRKQNYNGSITLTVTYNDVYRAVYVVAQ